MAPKRNAKGQYVKKSKKKKGKKSKRKGSSELKSLRARVKKLEASKGRRRKRGVSRLSKLARLLPRFSPYSSSINSPDVSFGNSVVGLMPDDYSMPIGPSRPM